MQNFSFSKSQIIQDPNQTPCDSIEQLILNQNPEDTRYIAVYASPTSNCQLATIAAANQLLAPEPTDKEALLDALTLLWEKARKNIFLFDIQQIYLPKLKNIFDEKDFILISNYESTNQSRMAIVLVKTNVLQDRFYEKNKEKLPDKSTFLQEGVLNLQNRRRYQRDWIFPSFSRPTTINTYRGTLTH